ncbi:dihydrofolate reductase family protein [Petropleomorpha daqingensis]|uniref:5-amino-6-(5-phosphoribosylamino)uracil reductase n=1 Tax=Petropleomorpha daqingensis TaxID=2026353 RepID=A0A853CMF8_9ACTN|nr:dihydrofolate reductase family protein [Petropleomorpha daqingensis]NYJ08910.1 5-amino-6-(5-phosphoribosylamino)uracil reductase [Petropleomorpha daqingensis]
MRRLLPEPGDGLTTEDVVEAYRLPPGRNLRVNFIASPDGSTTVAGKSRGLQMPGDLLVFRTLRALGDAILVGAGTAAAEGYGPMEDDPVVVRLREDLGRPATAPIVVVSRRASVPVDTRLIGGRAPSILVTCEAADPQRRAALAAAGLEVLVCGEDNVDLPLAQDRLAERGIEQLTCEGGPQLLHSALVAGVVDELDLSISPWLVGGHEVRLLPDVPLLAPSRLGLTSLLEEDGMLFVRYAIARN